MDFILANLAVGTHDEACSGPEDVDALLCVAEEKELPGRLPVEHRVPLPDMQPIQLEPLRKAVGWIDEHINQYSILLYCNAGVGRSPSVAVAYLCAARGMGFGEAVEHVARRRPQMSTLPRLIEVTDQLRAEWQSAG